MTRTGTAILMVALLTALSHALAADRCAAFADAGMSGASYTVHLPDAPGNFLDASRAWVPGANRRTGPQLNASAAGRRVHKEASSFQVWASQSDVTLYLYTGPFFDGEMLRYTCEKGYTCWIGGAGWFDDRLGSFICQREVIGEGFDGMLHDTPIPLGALVGEIRDRFHDQLSGSGSVASFGLGDTQVSRSTRTGGCWETFLCWPGYWDKYDDQIRMFQEMSIRPRWVVRTFDAWVKLFYRPRLGADDTLEFDWSIWQIWVEDRGFGRVSDRIRDELAETVGGSVVELEEELRQGVHDGIDEEVGALGLTDDIWEDVRQIGVATTCEPFNDRSGLSEPPEPFCWAPGSEPRMFAPTLILNH